MDGNEPSTKVYLVNPFTDEPVKGAVTQSYLHNSYTVPIYNLCDLYEAIEITRSHPNRYVIRGKGIEDEQISVRRTKFSNESPEGKFKETGTQWICCDFDKYLTPIKNRNSTEAIEWLIKNELPPEFHNISYIFQWSSSSGLEYNGKPIKDGTNVHLFFWLDRPLTNVELKTWFNTQIENGFDASTFNTVTPIYVGNFVDKDDRIIDTIPDDKKYGIVMKNVDSVSVPEIRLIERKYDTTVITWELTNQIMNKLQEIGAIHGKRSGWIKLRHPQERTPGDWFVKPNSPTVIHHHLHKSMRVDKWIKTFYGLDVKFNFETNTKPVDRNSEIIKRLEFLNRKFGI